MSEKLDFYKCEICGTIIQVFHRGDGELVCCGHPMKLLQAKTSEDETGLQEKHVPMFRENKIIVGSVPHPMTPEHHIEFIEGISDDKKHLSITFLDNTEPAEAQLCPENDASCAIEYCNLHGLWKGAK